jgi:hypothetical protein
MNLEALLVIGGAPMPRVPGARYQYLLMGGYHEHTAKDKSWLSTDPSGSKGRACANARVARSATTLGENVAATTEVAAPDSHCSPLCPARGESRRLVIWVGRASRGPKQGRFNTILSLGRPPIGAREAAQLASASSANFCLSGWVAHLFTVPHPVPWRLVGTSAGALGTNYLARHP